VFVEGGVKAGCLGVVLGGRDPQRAGPHPDVLSMRIKPLGRHLANPPRSEKRDGLGGTSG
jgi:hypothetical protein